MAESSKDIEQLLSEYGEKGYLHLKGIIQPEATNELVNFIYGNLEEQRKIFFDHFGFHIDETDAVNKLVAEVSADQEKLLEVPEDLRHIMRGEFSLPVRLSEKIKLVPKANRLTRILKELLGAENIRMHYPPMARFKFPGANQASVPLHQDYPYNDHLEDFIIAWIPLCQITDDCGGVRVVEGSQRLGRLPHSHQGLWGYCLDDRASVEGLRDIHVLMEPGEALLFGGLTVHYSHDNTSKSARCSIDCRFFGDNVVSKKHYYDVGAQKVVSP